MTSSAEHVSSYEAPHDSSYEAPHESSIDGAAERSAAGKEAKLTCHTSQRPLRCCLTAAGT